MILKPDEMISHYTAFDHLRLYEQGYRNILLDVDNTITPYYQAIPDEKALGVVEKWKDCGFRVIVFSNNKDRRVSKVAAALHCEYYCWAMKPLPFRYFTAMRRFHLNKKETIGLGDQILTDVLGANLAGIYSIYCKQIVPGDAPWTAITRKGERLIFRYLLK